MVSIALITVTPDKGTLCHCDDRKLAVAWEMRPCSSVLLPLLFIIILGLHVTEGEWIEMDYYISSYEWWQGKPFGRINKQYYCKGSDPE